MPNDIQCRGIEKFAIALLVVAAAIAGCKSAAPKPPPSTATASAPAASRPGELSVAEAISILGTRAYSWWGNGPPGESQVEARMLLLSLGGEPFRDKQETRKYQPSPDDVPQLLAALHDPEYDVPAKLCVSLFLALLDNQEGRDYIASCTRSQNRQIAANTAQLLLNSRWEDTPWLRGQLLAVLESDRLLPQNWTRDEAKAVLKDKVAWDAVLAQYKDEGYGLGSATFDDLCRYLAEGKCVETVPALARLVLLHPSNDTAVMTLAQLDTAAAEPVLLRTLFESRRYNVFEIIPNLEYRTPDDFQRAWEFDEEAKSQEKKFRWQQLQELAKLKSQKLVPILLANMDLNGAIDALVEIQGAKAADALREYIKDKQAGRIQF